MGRTAALAAILTLAAACRAREGESLRGKWHSATTSEVLEFFPDGRVQVTRGESARGGTFKWTDGGRIEITPMKDGAPSGNPRPYDVDLSKGRLILTDEKGKSLEYCRNLDMAARDKAWGTSLPGRMAMALGAGKDSLHDRIRAIRERAARAYAENRFDDALREYKEALQLAGDEGASAGVTDGLRASIREIRDVRALISDAGREYQDFKRRVETGAADNGTLKEEGRRLLERHDGKGYPWMDDLSDLIRSLSAAGPKVDFQDDDFQFWRSRIMRDCALDDRKKADYGWAIRLYRNYMIASASRIGCSRAESEISRLQSLSLEAAEALRRKSERLFEDGDAKGARALLLEARRWFEGADGEKVLEGQIRRFARE